MERPEQLRLLGGIALGVGATLAVLQLLGVNLSAAPAGGKQHLEGQLVNRSLLQKRHAFHADVVDDDDDLSSEDESGGGRGKKGDKGAGGKGEGEAASWQEKEDSLIRLLFDLMRDRNIPLKDACEISEHLIYEHLAGVSTDLAAVAPELVQPSARASATRHLHSALPLSEAFRKYDSQTHVSSRKKVPPQFREVRNIVNLAQVLASATAGLKLITFDGDGTLYPDRTVLDDELEERPGTPGLIGEEPPRNPDTTPGALITRLMGLLEAGVTVALVTAVGDPRPEPFEKRMIGLIRRIQRRGPGAKPVSLYAVGGQCNYVFRYDCNKHKFVPLAREKWEPESMRHWNTHNINAMLDAAEAALVVTANQLGMASCVKLVRKERAVGLLYTGTYHRTTAYFLDELALKARDAVKRLLRQGHLHLPFCTFNGGRDVFVDVGSKELGIDMLRGLVGAERAETLHMGDQFTRTGNDLLARRACGTVWVDDPGETAAMLRELLSAMDERKRLLY